MGGQISMLLARLYHVTRIYWLFFVFAILIALDRSNVIALTALVLIFGWRVLIEMRYRLKCLSGASVLFFTMGILIYRVGVQHASKLIERSAGLMSWSNVELWQRPGISGYFPCSG